MIVATDWHRWIGFCNDPVETDGWVIWVRVKGRGFYLGNWRFHLIRE